MRWDKSFEIGHEEVDKQHEELFKKLNYLVLASKDSDRYPQRFSMTLELLVNFCLLHFSLEENVMLRCDYPNYIKHKEQHENFIIVLNKYSEEFLKKGASEKLAKDIDESVSIWLQNHIAGEDQRIAEFIRKNL